MATLGKSRLFKKHFCLSPNFATARSSKMSGKKKATATSPLDQAPSPLKRFRADQGSALDASPAKRLRDASSPEASMSPLKRLELALGGSKLENLDTMKTESTVAGENEAMLSLFVSHSVTFLL